MIEQALPKEFEGMNFLVKEWALPSTADRRRKRNQSSQDELRLFYDVVFPQARAVLNYLNSVPYDSHITGADRNLLNLYLSLAEIVTAVEWYGQPDVVDGYDPSMIRMPVELP
jgi:hypothetical protein